MVVPALIALWKVMKVAGKMFVTTKSYIPMGVSAFVIIINLMKAGLFAAQTKDPVFFLKELAQTIFTLDFQVYELTQMFIGDPNTLTFFSFMTILTYIYVFFFIIAKYLAKIISVSNGTGVIMFMDYVWSLAILALIELVGINLLSDTFFFPGKGFFLFIVHAGAMIAQLQSNFTLSEHTRNLFRDTNTVKP